SAQVEGLKPPFSKTSYLEDLASPNSFSERHFDMWSIFGTVEYKVDEHWTLQAGYACAERPPTLTELYADTPFLAVVQNGFNFVVGNPDLSPEQDQQMDFGVKVNYERFRGGMN